MTSRGGDLERSDVEAALAARQELGPAYDAALVDSFAERVERAVQRRVAAEIQRGRTAEKHAHGDRQRQLALGIVSLGVGIPITAITGPGMDSIVALGISWLGIVGVNLAHAMTVTRVRVTNR